MKEFTVTKIEFKKTKIAQVFESLKDKLGSTRVFFELRSVDAKMDNNAFWDENGFRKYFFKEKNVLTGSDKTIGISNLDNNWRDENVNCSEPISIEQAMSLVTFREKKMGYHYSTFLIGFDFSGCDSERKYGYQKARGYFARGYNYLSDSIILYSCPLEKRCMYISKSEDMKTPILDEEILELFPDSKLIEEKKFYMPSDEEEALEWENRYAKAKTSFETMVKGIKQVYSSLPYDLKPRLYDCYNEKETIKIKSIAKKKLEPLGWELLKNKPGQKGIYFIKSHLDGNIVTNIDALHGGHYLQIQIFYVGKKFYFFDNINFTYNVFNDEDAEKFLGNLIYVLEYIEKTLE